MKFSNRKILSLLNLIGLGVALVMAIGASAEGQALPPDVGIVTQLSGDVTYRNEDYQKTPGKVQVFMKILQGDCFKVEPKAMLQLVYFRSGRKETWKGPATLVVGEMQGQAEGKKGTQAQQEVEILPVGVSEGMRRIPALLRRAGLSRSGTMQVRGLGESFQKSKGLSEEEQKEIAMAKKNYRNLRTQTKEDDITPELYLLGILGAYDQFEEMVKVIKDALKIHPDNEGLKKLEEWVQIQKTESRKK
jgi:hypothetical protein